MSEKRYIILINAEKNELSAKLIEYFNSNNWSWWHHVSHSWLVVDGKGDSDREIIESKLNEIFPKVHNVIFEVTKSTWIGFGPSGDDHTYFNWLKETWNQSE